MTEDRSTSPTDADTHADTQPCRICAKPVSTDSETFPFCSNRCRLVDMGNWFDGEYRISREVKDSDLDTID